MNKFYSFLLMAGFGLLISVGCSKPPAKQDTSDGFIGNWKVTESSGEIYYMTLKTNGSSSSTHDGGEFGKWKRKKDHIEIEWFPKTFKLYFNPGSSKPLLENPTPDQPKPSPSVAEKVEKIPG
jgi:hypothetical protein